MGNKNSKNNLGNNNLKVNINNLNEKSIEGWNLIDNSNKNQNQKIIENKGKKSISFFYNNTKQVIKYYGKFDPISTKKILKERFFIEESIDQIFFQDEEEDIIILNSNIPDNLSVQLFIQRDLIPKNPSKVLKIATNSKDNNNILKFHWVLENEERHLKFKDAIINKYTYKNTKIDEMHPSARSSVTFTTGVHFCVIRVGTFDSYECLRVVDDYSPDIYDEWSYNHNTLIGFSSNVEVPHKFGSTADVGIFIDMERKKCAFYNYEKKKIINCNNMVGKIKSDGVKIVAWLKRGFFGEKAGMTILNEGCIPIPDWVKI